MPFKTIDDLDVLLKHHAYHPSCWDELEKYLPPNWAETHFLVSIGRFVKVDDRVRLGEGVIIEDEKYFNEQIHFGHAIVVVPKSEIQFNEKETEDEEDDIFDIITKYPAYSPRSDVEFFNYLPANWEESFTVYAIEASDVNADATYDIPVRIQTMEQIKLLIILNQDSFFLVPNSETEELDKLIADAEEQDGEDDSE